MAERRMFAKTIIDSDAFLDMPLSTQALYFHLSMRADDDGFINNPKKIQRLLGCSDDDMKILEIKNFLIPFDSGVVVIKHWRIHNYIRKDRYKETTYEFEKSALSVKNNGAYTIGLPVGQPNVNQLSDKRATQVRLGKDSIDKDSIDHIVVVIDEEEEQQQTTTTTTKSKRFKKPTVDEIRAYCQERKNGIDAEYFYNYYESKGWLVGKSPMKSWKAAVVTWEKKEFNGGVKNEPSNARNGEKFNRKNGWFE